MSAHRYWRLTGFSVKAGGSLALSEVMFYLAGVRVGVDVVPSCDFAPLIGTLAALSDDSTLIEVAWPPAVHSVSGFALVWDLSGTGTDIDGMRLGSGTSEDTFPYQVTLQWSDDALAWTTQSVVSAIAPPGQSSLTTLTTVDPTFNKVVLLLPGTGADLSTTIVDTGPSSRSVTCVGGAKISTAQSKFGSGSMYLDGNNGSRITVPLDALDFEQDWCIAFWVYRKYAQQEVLLHIRSTQPVGLAIEGQNGIHIHLSASGALNVDNGVIGTTASAAGVVPVAEWSFIEVLRSAAVTTAYVSTTAVLSHSSQSTMGLMREVGIGRFTQNNLSNQTLPNLNGYINDLRIKLGVAERAVAVPSTPFGSASLIPTDNRVYFKNSSPPTCFVGAPMQDFNINEFTPQTSFMDAYHGGRGIIRATVKQKNTPVNTPLRRRVDLIDERSRLVIRSTWSDTVTGIYAFSGIREDLVYTVVSYDLLHDKRAVIADNLTLANGGVELLP